MATNNALPKVGVGALALGAGLLIALVIAFNASITIKAGEAGILFRTFGSGVDIDRTYGEGFHFIAPWNDMVTYTVRQQESKDKMIVLASNGLDITLDVSTWFQPSYDQLPLLHKQKGVAYASVVVQPAIRSAARSVIGRYAPEEIYSTKRDAIQTEIFEETKRILGAQYVQVNEVLVRDITLPTAIKEAIERKLNQEQESLEYEFRLQKEQKEAERIRIQASGKAAANEILNASLTANILKEKGIAATLELAKSPNSKVVIVGNSEGLPLILGNN